MFSIFKKQRGQVTALLAVNLTLILAAIVLVLDIGIGVLNRSRLQAAADAAALAAVRELRNNDTDAAYQTAVEYAENNGISGDLVSVSFPDGGASQLIVTIEQPQTYRVAKVFGDAEGDVDAQTTAMTGAASTIRYASGIGVVQQSFQLGEEYTLMREPGDCDHAAGSCANYGPLSLGGEGANNYEEVLTHGYQGDISVGQEIYTEPGRMFGPTQDAVEYRINQAPDETYDTVGPNSPRVLFIALTESLELNGRDQTTVVGFAAFFLEGVDNSGAVTGRFIEYNAVGAIGPNSPDFGVWTSEIIQ